MSFAHVSWLPPDPIIIDWACQSKLCVVSLSQVSCVFYLNNTITQKKFKKINVICDTAMELLLHKEVLCRLIVCINR